MLSSKTISFLCHITLILGQVFMLVGSEISINQERFPFSKQPDLSWQQFEREFRSAYKDITIPTIVLDNECDFAPMYIHDQEDEYLEKFNTAHKADPQEPPFIIMNMVTAGLSTPDEVAYVLLHEIGHHYYNQLQHKRNHARAKRVANGLNNGVTCAVIGLNAWLLYQNAYHLSQKRLPRKAILAQALALTVYANMTDISKSIETLCDDMIGTKPEEFRADDFAHQHATKAVLQAGIHLWSKEHFIDKCFFDCVQDFQTTKSIQDMDVESKNIMMKVAHFLNSSQRFLLSGLYNAHQLFCQSHPSPYQRQQLVSQALKNRFSNDQ